MNLRTYQAYSMAEALAAVKRDLGADAVILNTRSFKRGGFLGIGRQTIVEVTATTAQQAREAVTASNKKKAKALAAAAPAALKAYLGKASPSKKTAAPAAEPDDAPSKLDLVKTRRLAQAMLAKHERRDERHSEPVRAEALLAPAAATIETRAMPPAPGDHDAGEAKGSPVARRFLLRDPDGGADGPSAAAIDATPPATAEGNGQGLAAATKRREGRHRPVPRRAPIRLAEDDGQATPDRGPAAQAVQDELAAIKDMVGHVLQRQVTSGGQVVPTMPARLFDLYLKLIGQDLSEELADRIVNDVRDELGAAELEDEAALREAVRRHLADYIPTAEEAVPLRSSDGRPLTFALVGPTGVGKTTTLAKLAASFKLRHHRKVGLITADTYRIAAVDQLRTYANIIGLPLKVVLTPTEMRQAMAALNDCDVILIDTAGRSQNDSARLEELKRFIAAADPHEVHLVLSSTAGEKVLLREAEAFSAIGVDKVVLTKLDEAVSFGVLINVVRQIGLRLSFLTTGQEVPDHIEIGRSERLAELVLGGEVER